jgi:hypothetical protein
MQTFGQGARLFEENPRARERLKERVTGVAARLGWDLDFTSGILTRIGRTMAQVPSIIDTTWHTDPRARPALHGLLQRLGDPLPTDGGEAADDMLARTYVALRVLAPLEALTSYGLFMLVATSDIIGPTRAMELDAEITGAILSVPLASIGALAMECQQLQVLRRWKEPPGAGFIAGETSHVVYGNISITDLVTLEMGRAGLV